MYHILPTQRQRQYGAFRWKDQGFGTRSFGTLADAKRLVELAAAILAGIGGAKQQMDLAAAGRDLDLVGAGDQGPGARLEAEPVERRLPKRRLDPLAKVGGNGKIGRLEGADQGALEPALRLGLFERDTADAD